MYLGKCLHQLLEDRASVDYRDEERCRKDHLLAIVTRDGTDCDSSIFFSGVPSTSWLFLREIKIIVILLSSKAISISLPFSHTKPVRLSPKLMFKLMRKLAET